MCYLLKPHRTCFLIRTQWNQCWMLLNCGVGEDSCGEGNGTPLQYSCLENPMDRGAWQAAVHGVVKRWTQLSDFTFTFHFHALEKEMATHSSVLAWRIPGTGDPGRLPLMGLQSQIRLKLLSRSISSGRLLRVLWTARRSNQSILKDINPGYSLEGLILMLKLQYLGHLIQRVDLLEKILMLGKIKSKRKRG